MRTSLASFFLVVVVCLNGVQVDEIRVGEFILNDGENSLKGDMNIVDVNSCGSMVSVFGAYLLVMEESEYEFQGKCIGVDGDDMALGGDEDGDNFVNRSEFFEGDVGCCEDRWSLGYLVGVGGVCLVERDYDVNLDMVALWRYDLDFIKGDTSRLLEGDLGRSLGRDGDEGVEDVCERSNSENCSNFENCSIDEETVPPINRHKSKFNYASSSCGAEVLAWNPEASQVSSVIKSSWDSYMLNPCNARNKWFVIKLCESVAIHRVTIFNGEYFSGMPKMIELEVSNKYPSEGWRSLGHFFIQNVRKVHILDIEEPTPTWFRYLKVKVHSTWGNSYYCPITEIQVFGLPYTTKLHAQLNEKSASIPQNITNCLQKATSTPHANATETPRVGLEKLQSHDLEILLNRIENFMNTQDNSFINNTLNDMSEYNEEVEGMRDNENDCTINKQNIINLIQSVIKAVKRIERGFVQYSNHLNDVTTLTTQNTKELLLLTENFNALVSSIYLTLNDKILETTTNYSRQINHLASEHKLYFQSGFVSYTILAFLLNFAMTLVLLLVGFATFSKLCGISFYKKFLN